MKIEEQLSRKMMMILRKVAIFLCSHVDDTIGSNLIDINQSIALVSRDAMPVIKI